MKPLKLHSISVPTVTLCFILFGLLPSNAQVANFSADKTSGCSPLVVQFSDLSTGTNSSSTYLWTFGNGNTSIEKNPAAQYVTPGTYTVTLKVTNGATSSTETKTGFITVRANPVANFSHNPSTGCAPLNVSFTDVSTSSSGAITEWEWVFGDGETAATQNPVHAYSNVNIYSVTLRVKNQYGCQDTESKPAIINVSGPTASFTVNDDNFCSSPALVEFTNTSVENEPLTYHWSFGDGQTSTSRDVDHTYMTEGTFNVVLTATNAAQCSDVYTQTIVVGGAGGADFTMSKSEICLGEAIAFSATFDNLVLTKEWDFGDGETSNVLNPTHQFLTPGQYTVTLRGSTITTPCVRVSKTVKVNALPVPDFNFNASGCTAEVNFTNTSTNSTSWEWDFGDFTTTSSEKDPKHTYSAPGSFNVTLNAISNKGCEKSVTKVVSTGTAPVAQFSPQASQDCAQPSLSGCAPFNLSLTNLSFGGSSSISQTTWDFGDGSTSNSYHTNHTYTSTGSFSLTLEVKNQDGCTSNLTRTVVVSNVTPVADFTVNKTTVCVGELISFSADATTNGNFYCWDTGDGFERSGKNFNYAYSQPGVYTVKLKAKNGGCENIKTVTNLITVKDPGANLQALKTCADPFHVNFVNTSVGFDSYVWDFGDGTTSSSDPNPQKIYAAEGTYKASITVSNATTGCTAKKEVDVKIQKIVADFSITEDKPCLGETIVLTDKSKSAVRWSWSFGDGIVSTLQNTSKTYAAPGNYNLKLTAYDSENCPDNLVVPVEVLDIRGGFSFQSVSHCDYLSVDFEDQSTIGAGINITDWQWDFGDQQSGQGENIHHDYQDEGSYTVKLTLQTDQSKECSVTRTGVINFQTPVPVIVLAKPGFCIGETVNLYNNSANAISYEWELPDGSTTTSFHTSAVFDQEGKYDVKLTATDASGCSRTANGDDLIVITKPDASFDARETMADCPPLITYFDNNSADATTYQWFFGDGQSSTVSDPVNTYHRPGTFDVKLIVKDVHGCLDSAKMSQVVKVGGPDGTITVGSLAGCVGDEITFNAVSTNTVTHRWDFGDGNVVSLPEPNTTHRYDTGTLAFITAVFIDANGCEVPALENYVVQIANNPQVSFTYEPLYPFEHETITLHAISDTPNVTWASADVPGIPDGLDTQVTFDSAGLKLITVSALNDAGCATDTTQQIAVQGDIVLYNVFTPNNDDKNEGFVVKNVEQGNWFLQVYDRWGGKVFDQHNYMNGWKGFGVNAGVYYYTIVNQNRPDKFYRGIVTIIK